MNAVTSNRRLLPIDLARGLAVFFMIAVHTLEVFASEEVKKSMFGQIIEFFGGAPAAPVFMTLMGFSFMYSRKSDLKQRLLRGFKIFLSGYLLNIIRGVIPFKLAIFLQLDIAQSFPLERLNETSILAIVDILQFAGIALMIMAIIQEFNVNKHLLLLAAFAIILVSPFLWGYNLNMPFVDYFLDLLWGDYPISFGFINNKIAFPVFPWLAFPLLGMFLGETIKNSKNQNTTYNYFGFFGFVTLIIGAFITATDFDYHTNDYNHSRQGAMIFMCGFVIGWIYLNKLLIEKLPMNRLFLLLFVWSNGVSNIYFVQWTIIIWSIGIFGSNSSSFLTVIFLIATFILISHFTNALILFTQRRNSYS